MVEQQQLLAERRPSRQQGSVAALMITTDENDRRLMAAAMESSGWELRIARDGFQARSMLANEFIPVVIVDGDASAGCWRELLEEFSGVAATPETRFIVISRLADERLWAEVLNLGAYDLLAKPLHAGEVEWVVRSALWERNGRRSSASPTDRKERGAWNGC